MALATEERVPARHWRAPLAALPLLALVAVGWLGVVPLLPLLLAVLLPFLARRNQETAVYAPWVAVFAAASAFAPLLGGPRELLAGFDPFFLSLGLAYLCGAALDGVTQGSLWAWLAPLLLFVVSPSAPGLLGGLGLGVLGALRGQAERSGGHARVVSPRGLLLLAGAGLALFLVTLPLTRPAAPLAPPDQPVVVRRAPTGSGGSLTGSGRSASASPPAVARRSAVPGDLTLIVINLSAIATALVAFLAYLVVSRAPQHAGGRRSRLVELLPLAAGLLLGIIVLAWGFAAYLRPPPAVEYRDGPAGRGAAGRSASGGQATQPLKVELPYWMLFLAGGASLAVIAVGGVLLVQFLRSPRSGQEEGADAAPPDGHDARLRAASRVRAAYAAFLERAAAAGVARAEAETPREFARRFGALWPAAATPATALTGLYEPVRYGALPEAGSGIAAEAALAEVSDLLAAHGEGTTEEK